MAIKGPGKAPGEGISLMELCDMFPDEAAAAEWFEYADLAEWSALSAL